MRARATTSEYEIVRRRDELRAPRVLDDGRVTLSTGRVAGAAAPAVS